MQRIFLGLAIFNFGITACDSKAEIEQINTIYNVVQEKSKDESKQTEAVFHNQPEKSVKEFYRWYLKEKTPSNEKLKTYISLRLFKKIGNTKESVRQNYFKSTTPDVNYETRHYYDIWVFDTKLISAEQNTATVEIQLTGDAKKATVMFIPLHVSLIRENDLWKIDSVEKQHY